MVTVSKSFLLGSNGSAIKIIIFQCRKRTPKCDLSPISYARREEEEEEEQRLPSRQRVFQTSHEGETRAQ